MTEPFDAVLAEVRKGWQTTKMRDYFDRLAAAHAAEVAERDARIAELKRGIVERGDDVIVPWQLYEEINRTGAEWKARAEAAERDARRWRWIREWHAFGPVAVLSATQNYKALEGPFLDAAIDTAIATTEQADD